MVVVRYAPRCGFRALKKTPEAPYTTKVNYRKHTAGDKQNVSPACV